MRAPLHAWTERLQHALDAAPGGGHVFVLAEADSTQDAARRLGAARGDVVTTLRQRAGRGRHGRSWADTADDGLAVTILAPAAAPAWLAVACAVGAGEALEAVGAGTVGLKWPNDLMGGGRKLGGILVEQDTRTAAIGIGVNVGQTSWPPDLQGRAVSLRELGSPAGRLETAAALVPRILAALERGEEEIVAAFAARDVLCGREAVIRAGERRLRGHIIRVEPMTHLVLEVDGVQIEIPAATASVESWIPGPGHRAGRFRSTPRDPCSETSAKLRDRP